MHIDFANFFSATSFDAKNAVTIFEGLPAELKNPNVKAALEANVVQVDRLAAGFSQTHQLEPDFYHPIFNGFTNAVTVFSASLPGDQKKTWQLLPTLVRNVADLARWMKDYKHLVEYDRQDLELAKANPDTYDTWLFIALSSLANDLLHWSGKENLTESETLSRQALAEAFKSLPDASEKNIVRAEIGGIYGQLVQTLIALEEWDQAHEELGKLIAFAKDCTDNDYESPLMDWNFYLMALQIASHFVPTEAFGDKWDKSVALGKDAVSMLPAMIDAQPNFMPKALLQLFELIGGHKDLAENHEKRKKNRHALLSKRLLHRCPCRLHPAPAKVDGAPAVTDGASDAKPATTTAV